MSDIRKWDPAAAGNNAAPPNGAPEGMPASTVNDSAREVMASVRRWFEDGGWADFDDTITFISDTSFSVPGDLTAVYEVGRRLRIAGILTGTVFAVIEASVFTSVTTVTFAPDSGTVANEELRVSLNIDPKGETTAPVVGAGVNMLFADPAAPDGWTLNAAVNDSVIRVNDTIGGGVGGDWIITGLTNDDVGSHVLTSAESGVPAHTHAYTDPTVGSSGTSGVGG